MWGGGGGDRENEGGDSGKACLKSWYLSQNLTDEWQLAEEWGRTDQTKKHYMLSREGMGCSKKRQGSGWYRWSGRVTVVGEEIGEVE